MQTHTIPLEETGYFSQTFLDYLAGKEELNQFLSARPRRENFKSLIENRNFPKMARELLSEELNKQYDGIETPELVVNNISLLKEEKTFTITTGHQLNIFTGPLYFHYKIITVINACKELKKVYPDYHFVPIYWMASEDHDFDEINHFQFEGNSIVWRTEQTGAVGRFDPKELALLASKLPKGAWVFQKAYNQNTLASAVRYYVNEFYGDDGLIVLDADHLALKKSLIPVIEDDLFSHSSEKLVTETSKTLESLGKKVQVYPRQINFFYLEKGIRERIEKTQEGFEVLNTSLKFSKDQLRELIHDHPERFSPNVILRPLYQEIILPNLAYVGGPSELIYWLQLKTVFDHFKVPFPVLMPRNFALIINSKISKKWKKTGLDRDDIFAPSQQLLAKWIIKNTDHTIDFKNELDKIRGVEATLKEKANAVDPTLTQHLEAIHAHYKSKIETAEKKLFRAEKRKHEAKKQQIESVKEALFPGGTLQERKENFLTFYLKDPLVLQKLKEAFDPFNFQMYVLEE